MLEIRGYNNSLESLIVWITVVEVKVTRVWANSDNSENYLEGLEESMGKNFPHNTRTW